MLTPNQLAEKLGVSRWTIERMRERGDIPYIHLTRGPVKNTYRFDYEAVIKALEARTNDED